MRSLRNPHLSIAILVDESEDAPLTVLSWARGANGVGATMPRGFSAEGAATGVDIGDGEPFVLGEGAEAFG